MARTLTPEDYFEAAFDHLEQEGFGALKQAALCTRLGVTTGSFYRHFENWQDFRTRLLREWYERRTESLIAVAASTDDPWQRLALLRAEVLGIPRAVEAAIRAWSVADPDVAVVQREVDEHRIALSTAAMAEVVGDEEAARFAMSGMYLLIGWESLGRGDTEHLDWALGTMLADAARLAAERGGPLPPA